VKASPTQRTLKKLRDEGWTVAIVEKTLPRCFIKQDLFGIIDILAIKPGRILGVQATADSHHKNRVNKATAEPRLQTWLEAGGEFEVWSWGQKGPKGKRKVWTPRIEALTSST
jgi:hypothetical protein